MTNDDVIARCPDCGTEQGEAFAACFVCLAASRWWCRECLDWRAARTCPPCGGGIGVPPDVVLGRHPAGAAVPFTIPARNTGRKPLSCPVSAADSGVALATARLLIPPSGSAELSGVVTPPRGPPGPRTFRVRFDGPVPAETRLLLEVVAPAPRLEFVPAAVALAAPRPGGTVRTSVTLKNTGNVPLGVRVSASEPWLVVDPVEVDLAPGERASVRLGAKSKRTDSGAREARVRAEADGRAWDAPVRLALPEPQLAADPVAFGELKPGRAAVADVVVRNTGRVRVTCALAASVPWLQVRPARLNLPPGRQKAVRARALLSGAEDGALHAELVASAPTGVVLRVPVTATGRAPQPLLRPVRRQRVRDAVGAAVERKFQVANDGDGRLVCTATADRPWVRIVTPALTVGPGKKRRLRYVLDLPALPRGEHRATITLATNGGTGAVPVTVHVLDPNPILEVVGTPDLGAVSPDLPLAAFVRVRNAGVGLLAVRAESEDPRVVVTPAAAEVPAGPPVRFDVRVPLAGLAGGEHERAVRFASNGGSGRAVVRFRLPVERIDVPAMIDLGDRPAGRAAGGAVCVRNVGPDRVTLRVSGDGAGVAPALDRITVEPGATAAVPFVLSVAGGAFGPLTAAIEFEGRTVRGRVAVRATARKVELVVVPDAVALGPVRPGAERAFVLDVTNAGELAVEIPDLHVPGELEVWLRRATVPPGARVAVAGRVRVNARAPGREVRAVIDLAGAAAVPCLARVAQPAVPRGLVVATLTLATAVGGVLVGEALTAVAGGWVGVIFSAVLLSAAGRLRHRLR